MKEILGRVVTEGTGEIAASPLFTACGKTGTAEKPPYSSKEVIATFVGFFPKENPQYVVAISVDNPRIGKYAGTIACPAFRRICERCCLLPIPGSKFQVTSSQLPVASQLGTVNVRHDTGNSDGAKQ
jgi:membrane carboxypeptidase/penicillin-binding protein